MDISRTKSKETKGVFGSPKKGGAGGKGTWGKGGVDDLITVRTDNRDPNYDSGDEDDRVILQHIPVETSPTEQILRDFFMEADNAEAARRITEEDVSRPEFVRKAVYLSMDYQPYERECVSRLLSELYGSTITSEQFAEGFQTALDKLDDAVLDIPLADEMLGKFMARAIVDEIVPPAFLKSCFSDSKLAKGSVSLAAGLVNDPHRSRKLEHIWGPGDLVSVKRLKQEAHKLIEEYVATGDKSEADRSVRALNAPSFHSQLVRYAIRVAIDAKSESDRKKVLELLSFLSKGGLVSADHISRGFKQYSDMMDDHKLDTPGAPAIFDSISKSAQSEGWLSSDFK